MKRLWLGLCAVPVLGVSTWLAVADPAKDAGLDAGAGAGPGAGGGGDWDAAGAREQPPGSSARRRHVGLQDRLHGPRGERGEGGDAGAGLRRQPARAPARGEDGRGRRGRARARKAARRPRPGAEGPRLRRSEAEARKRRAELQVEVPDELVSAHELAGARRDLALAEGEMRLLDEQIRSAERSATAAMAVVADRKEAAAGRVAQLQAAIGSDAAHGARARARWSTPRTGQREEEGRRLLLAGRDRDRDPRPARMEARGRGGRGRRRAVPSGQPVTLRLDAHPERRVPRQGGGRARTVQQQSWRNPLKVVRLDIDAGRRPTRSACARGCASAARSRLERIARARWSPAEAVFASEPRAPSSTARRWLRLRARARRGRPPQRDAGRGAGRGLGDRGTRGSGARPRRAGRAPT